LAEALVALCADPGFDRLTVVDLVERAGVSRTTFYRHYPDKFAMVDEVLAAGFRQWEAQPGSPAPNSPAPGGADLPRPRVGQDGAVVSAVEQFFRHVACHARLYHGLLVVRRSEWFERRLVHGIRSAWWLHGPVPPTCADSLLSCARASAFVGLLVAWLDQGLRQPPAAVAQRYLALTPVAASPADHPPRPIE
jgi:AcrR family transcriptional regulator